MRQTKDGPVPNLSEMVRSNSGTYDPNDPLARYPRMVHPHSHPEFEVGPLAMRYMLDQRIYAVLKGLFREEPMAVQSMFYFKPPGARGQDLHQDNFFLRVKPGTCCAAWIAIDDADENNGGMVVVPGSNGMEIICPEKSDTTKSFTDHHVPVPEGLEELPVILKAGDVLFFNGSVIHGSYPNSSTDRFRRSLIFHYVPESTAELSNFYKAHRFDGEHVPVAEAAGGGPCGDFAPMAAH
jgi:ectoine hydroxylase-related dioxygenase (phytanoyl-CoA dioxygenase family)